MVVAAEQTHEYGYTLPREELDITQLFPRVMALHEVLPNDTRAEHLIRSLGATALDNQVEAPVAVRPRFAHLMDAMQQAAAGNPTARQLVETNVRTDVIERTIKAGHVMEVPLEVDDDGAIMQHGQTMEAVQANTLRYASELPQMRRRAEAETRNAFAIDTARRLGLLEEYNVVVFSPAADDMTDEQMEHAGFFVQTMSMAIQSTGYRKGQLRTESAFVAGVARPGAARHDRQALRALGERWGVDLDKPATETLASALLIHKECMPNGVVDIVELFDRELGTFFGEGKPRQDYIAYRQQCERRQQSFEPRVQAITRELLEAAPLVSTPQAATALLQQLSGKHMIEKAAEDHTIDPWVFGPQSAAHIEMARWQAEQGNTELAMHEVRSAVSADQSRSCPSGGTAAPQTQTAESSSATSSRSSDECEFISKQCPVCKKKNVKTVVTKTSIRGACGCSKRK
ncbi:MAG TPA: hypothetical protein VFN56_05510 [Candidatus Saccharimonadales bacterium]|nr:hypothetical protein [Candidatus Saccharimonadales bacterium]